MKARQLIEQWPVDSAAAAWFGPGGSDQFGELDLPYALASVTKPLFAYAVLIAVEEGTLSLEDACGPEGSTVRHVLAHASGLGEDRAAPAAEVGSRRIYSNLGFGLLAETLASAAGMSASDYFHLAVVEPLGLTGTRLAGSAAHGAVSTADDLRLVLAEWLAPTLVHPATMTEAATPQFPDLAGVLPGWGRHDPNPWGLGFELRREKSPHWTGSTNSVATYGHFGRAGTFVWADPAARSACVALTDREFGPWAKEVWPPFCDAVLDDIATKPGV
ncbi:MAG: serine hydrolase domain-containing protein [Actinomycetota bacterium]